jgi:hypothetical protein
MDIDDILPFLLSFSFIGGLLNGANSSWDAVTYSDMIINDRIVVNDAEVGLVD